MLKYKSKILSSIILGLLFFIGFFIITIAQELEYREIRNSFNNPYLIAYLFMISISIIARQKTDVKLEIYRYKNIFEYIKTKSLSFCFYYFVFLISIYFLIVIMFTVLDINFNYISITLFFLNFLIIFIILYLFGIIIVIRTNSNKCYYIIASILYLFYLIEFITNYEILVNINIFAFLVYDSVTIQTHLFILYLLIITIWFFITIRMKVELK